MLVEAIVRCFSDSQEAWFALSNFTRRDWAATEFWLDTSGLALYFLDRARLLELDHFVDSTIARKLALKHADNQLRLTSMMQEFCEMNRAFQEAGVRFANLKGATFYPYSCSDLSLRYQSDHDFLVDPDHLSISQDILQRRGYVLTAAKPSSLEFKTPGAIRTSIEGQYKAAGPRSAELHTSINDPAGFQAGRDPYLERLQLWRWNEARFPALSPPDQLVSQALHIFGHLRNEHTRASWLLEFRNHVLARKGDEPFWKAVHSLADENQEKSLALGIASSLAEDLFGPMAGSEIHGLQERLPHRVKLWIHSYGRKAVLADVPGTKLYILLEDALNSERSPRPQRQLFRRLVPTRLPSRIQRPIPHETLRMRLRREGAELAFLLFRLRFHVLHGLRHLIEAQRWKRLCSAPCAIDHPH
jgi:hypothetical protein